MKLSAADLQSAVHAADDSVTIDLGAIMGLRQSVLVGVDDVHELLLTGEPQFHVEVDAGNASVTVRRTDSSWLAGLEIKF